jgi:aspartyl-tRNA(Asn)/glutamyl-tRNA(Gln) amidotransferase subunit C
MLTKEEILHIAKLAKLNLSDEEIEKFRMQISPILDYIEKLKEVDTENVEPTFHPIADLKNRFQEEGMDDALDVKDVTKNAKEKDGDYILTGAVL